MINAVCDDEGSEFEVTNIDRWVRIVAPADEKKTRITVEDDEKTRWQAPQD